MAWRVGWRRRSGRGAGHRNRALQRVNFLTASQFFDTLRGVAVECVNSLTVCVKSLTVCVKSLTESQSFDTLHGSEVAGCQSFDSVSKF